MFVLVVGTGLQLDWVNVLNDVAPFIFDLDKQNDFNKERLLVLLGGVT